MSTLSARHCQVSFRTEPRYLDFVIEQELEKKHLRERIVLASVELIEEAGLPALSMREVARRAGVSHQAPYYYFQDREAILAAVAESGFNILNERLTAARSKAAGATDALEQTAIAYVTFALEHPAHFRLMFRPELVTLANHDDAQRSADAAFSHVPEMAMEYIKMGLPPETDLETMSAFLWSVVHGLSCLLVDGPLSTTIPSFTDDKNGAIRAVAHMARNMMDASIAWTQSQRSNATGGAQARTRKPKATRRSKK